MTDWYQPGRRFNAVELLRQVRRHDLVFGWFASWHTLAPVLLARRMGRAAVVVIGGYDTANVPAAAYGSQRGGLVRVVARLVISQATHLVTNSDAARQEAIANAGATARKITVLYHGVEPLPAGPDGQRECLALTVGGIWRENLLRKGLLPFVQAAALCPDVRFIVAGRAYDDSLAVLQRAAGPNVEFTGFLPDADLASLYARASVYVQPSLHEGFGLSVAEAMSAGCVPVVTRAGALPEVVGDCGIYCESNAPAAVAAAIRKGLAARPDIRRRARQRIIDDFPLERRRQGLVRLLAAL
ncbi:MAG TPA: glycosyltransferase [Chloroflexia bacterium]|nr:glycosyltransferase [Chloroflexia bacterium]